MHFTTKQIYWKNVALMSGLSCVSFVHYSSPSVKQRTNVFYLQPERCCVPNSPMWFSSVPLEGDAMQAMLTRILTVR